MIKGVILIVVFACSVHSLRAQDTIRIMYYNLLNYPNVSPERVSNLRQIVGYTKPDILVVNELLNETGANLILNEGLNVWGADNYAAANFIDGPDTDNMLFYNTDLLGLVNQQQIPTALRDISEYKLYYKSPGLNASSDSVYLTIYSLHLKAGSGFYNERKEEAIILKYYLNSLYNTENVFVGGDFNFYSGNESGCIAIRETGGVDLFDPIASIGNWSGNSSYANIHTQSTRTAALADGAGGGLDDRFDLIFVSEDVLNNQNGLNFIDGSYKAFGQDGDRFNDAINTPYNPTVPDSIADALYFMSDHLPVMMDLKTDYTAGILPNEKNVPTWYYNVATNTLVFSNPIENAHFSLFNLSGKRIASFHIESVKYVPIPIDLAKGVLLWSITSQTYFIRGKLSIR